MVDYPFRHVFFHIATVTPGWEAFDKTEKKFPPVILHRPIAVSLLRLSKAAEGDDVDVNIMSKGIHSIEDEGSLTSAFFDKVPGSMSTLVTFMGRSFGLPVMTYSALRHGIVAQEYLKDQEVFTARFSPQHVDLSDFLSGYGTVTSSGSLSDYAQMVGLGKRPYLDVAKAFADGANGSQAIVDKLEVDVLLIAAIYFRLLLSQGKLSVDNYRKVAKTTLKAYYDKSEFAKKFLEGAGAKEYLRAGHPTKKG